MSGTVRLTLVSHAMTAAMSAGRFPIDEALNGLGHRQVIGAADVERLRKRLQVLIDEDLENDDPRRAQDRWMVLNVMLRDPEFMELLVNPALRSAVDAVLGDTSILYAFVTSSMPPTGTNYSHRVHVDSQRVIPGYPTNLGVIVAFDDFTDDNGATYFLPGSFASERVPTDEEFMANAVRAYPRAGDAIIFNARTWHLGGNNVTGSPRHAVTMNYVRSYMRQHFDFPRMIDPADAATIISSVHGSYEGCTSIRMYGKRGQRMDKKRKGEKEERADVCCG